MRGEYHGRRASLKAAKKGLNNIWSSKRLFRMIVFAQQDDHVIRNFRLLPSSQTGPNGWEERYPGIVSGLSIQENQPLHRTNCTLQLWHRYMSIVGWTV